MIELNSAASRHDLIHARFTLFLYLLFDHGAGDFVCIHVAVIRIMGAEKINIARGGLLVIAQRH